MPRFVVHDHRARTHHYDVRLEHDGVLVSWAVPKGLPERAGERRLAIRTPDHPLEYIDFAGTIPAGMYGAGEVTVHDHGEYDTRSPGQRTGSKSGSTAAATQDRISSCRSGGPARISGSSSGPGTGSYKRVCGLVGSMAGAYTTDCPPGGEDADSWIRRGMACTRRRKYATAIESFDQALGHEPGSIEALLGRGNALYALERYDEALAGYDRAVERAPDRPAPQMARANALTALGRKDEAAAAFARAMDLRHRPERG